MSDKYRKEPLEIRVSVRVTRSDLEALKDLAADRRQTVGEVIRNALGTPSSHVRNQVLAGGAEVENLARVLSEYEALFFKLYTHYDPRSTRLERAVKFVKAERLARIERQRTEKKFS